MSTISLDLPESLHIHVQQLANKEQVSINNFIVLALAEKLSALTTEDYLTARARLGERKKFEQAMAKVSKHLPEEYDKLPII
jgi:hypothetical protein